MAIYKEMSYLDNQNQANPAQVNDSKQRDQLIGELAKLMDRLPQRDAIELSDAKQWISFVATFFEPKEARWHMIRAGGVGGSEIGMLVRNYMGQRADFSNTGGNAHDWALGKLLRQTPSGDKPQFRRGHFMEPLIAERLYDEFGCKRHKKDYDTLSNAQGSHIWMRYSPDELVTFNQPTQVNEFGDIAQGKILADYKAPTEVLDAEQINFQYICQLNQGAILCEEQGIDIDALMLVRMDWKNWRLVNNIFQPSKDIQQVIKLSGDYYWDYVMRGEIPKYVIPAKLSLNQERLQQWADLTQRYAQVKALSTAFANESESLREIIFDKGGIDKGRLGEEVLEVPKVFKASGSARLDEDIVYETLLLHGYSEEDLKAIQIKETAVKYDTGAIIDYLKEQGIDHKQFRKRLKLDPNAAWAALLDAGLNPDDYIYEQKNIRIDRDYHKWARQWVSDTFAQLNIPDQPLIQIEAEESPIDSVEDFSESKKSKLRMS